MSDILEVLFTCDNNEHQVSCTAWDYRSGTNVMSYKGGGLVQQNTLCFLRSEYILTANSTRPLIHVWPLNSQEQISSVRFVAPGKPNALAVSPDGNFMVAGIQEVLYIWQVTTGKMLNSISKHYQTISCLKFTDDASHFVSAGNDGGVIVWNLTQTVAPSEENQFPLYSFNDHGLSVTDVHIGTGGIKAYMATVSLDRTCKIYDLSSGTLLLNVVFAECLQCVVQNALETCVYVGTTSGCIYEFNIDALPRSKEYHMEKKENKIFSGHQSAVTCIALSLDGHTLISGSDDKQVCIWDIPSKQLVKSLPHKGAVSNIAIRLSSLAVFHPEYKQPQIFTNNLKRMINHTDADDDEIVEILISQQGEQLFKYPQNPEGNVGSKLPYYPKSALLVDKPSDEISKLHKEIQKLKYINKKIYDVSVKKVFSNKNKH